MPTILHHGFPKEDEYRSLIKSDEFKEMEGFSNRFLEENRLHLGGYAKWWVKDPFHQWSRQWEYPYVFGQLQTFKNELGTIKILDAGSGATFFPYYIKSKFPSADVYCTDYDTTLEDIHQRINATSDDKVFFSSFDLKDLSYDDNWFDAIYCISVLEHTDDYRKIVRGFHRILRPGGSLIITFDVSLDGTRDIGMEKGNALLQLLTERFTVPMNLTLEPELVSDSIFTTLSAQNMDPNLLPWKLPSFIYQMVSLFRGKELISWPPPLSVYCMRLSKRDL